MKEKEKNVSPEVKKEGLVKRLFRRYLVDATGAMAMGLFSSLIIGLIISQIAKIPYLGFLTVVSDSLGAKSPVVGSAIGVAIAWGMKCDPLVIFSCAGTGAIGYTAGGPVGAYVGAVIGAEFGRLVSKKTFLDIIVTPLVTLISGGVVSGLVGPYINDFMLWLGSVVNAAVEFTPFWMGIVVAALVGVILTLPISSAALCIMIGIAGKAAGAAVAGCCAQMIGFAVISFRDNGWSGLLSQGLGTSMLQVPNLMRKPVLWIAPTVASAVCGAVSAYVFGMECSDIGAGMGTSGLVGQVATFTTMQPTWGTATTLLLIVFVHFLLPAAVALLVDFGMRKLGWVKPGDLALKKY